MNDPITYYRDDGSTITVEDRNPTHGEQTWIVPAECPLEEALVRVIGEIDVDEFSPMSHGYDRGEGWRYESYIPPVDAAYRCVTILIEVGAQEDQEIARARVLIHTAADWLENANEIIQDSSDAEEGDDEDAKIFIAELRAF